MTDEVSYDVVVIGGGLAGLTAGLFSARLGQSTLVIESTVPGGHLINVEKIEDFPGFGHGIAGYDLGPAVQEQAANNGAEFGLAEVQSLRAADPYWVIGTSDGSYRAKAVIIASGSHPRDLGIPGESRLVGRGISHCASCDGPLFQGKVLGVVGGGDSGLQEALTLAEYGSQVVIFERSAAVPGQSVYQQRIADQPKIQIRINTTVTEILGDDKVSGVRVHDVVSGADEVMELAGVFIYAGLTPSTAFLDGVIPLDGGGHVATDVWMRTAQAGLFAAGDVRQDSASQAVTSAGDGATAAIAAQRYVAGRSWS